MKTKPCPACNGSGRVIDQASLGLELRLYRESSGYSLRFVAEQMKISAPYLSDLERGHRLWNDQLINDYKTAIKMKK